MDRVLKIILSISLLLVVKVNATEPTSLAIERSYWLFSGVVKSDIGRNYGYFFKLSKNGNEHRASAFIIDAETKEIVFTGNSAKTIKNTSDNDWRFGDAFMRFNSINDSWVFGFKANKKGFNFKVDMLKQMEPKPVEEELKSGVVSKVGLVNNLNGYIEEEGREHFVTAKNSWLRYVSQSSTQEKPHLVTGVLCRVSDGSSFYSLNLSDSDALNASIAGWYDANNNAVDMSQFVQASQEGDAMWHIRALFPSIHLALEPIAKAQGAVAGFSKEPDSASFCIIDEDEIGT